MFYFSSLGQGYDAQHLISLPQEAVTAEQKSLGGQVESLLSWLQETEAQMNGGMAGMEKMEKVEKDGSCDQLTQQLCKASCPN